MTDSPPPPVPTERLAHLQMIQGVISRMATCSFAVKQWAVALVAVAGTLDLTSLGGFSWTLPVPLLALWLLDAWYLDQERLYRDLYDYVRAGNDTLPGDEHPFGMKATSLPAEHRTQSKGVWAAARRDVVWLLYAVLALTAIFAIVFGGE